MLNLYILTEIRSVFRGETTNGQKYAFFWKDGFREISEFSGNLNADLEDGDIRKSSRATSASQYCKVCRVAILRQPYGLHNIYMSVYGYAMNRTYRRTAAAIYLVCRDHRFARNLPVGFPPVRCRKSARFFQKLPFRTCGAGEKTRFLLKKSAGIRPKSAVTHWKSALKNIWKKICRMCCVE